MVNNIINKVTNSPRLLDKTNADVNVISTFGRDDMLCKINNSVSKVLTSNKLVHGLLIEYGPICHIVKLPISMIRPFSLVNISHITLYLQLEIFTQILGEIWTNLMLYY